MNLILLFLSIGVAWGSGVRDLNLKPRDVGTIRTSVGYSTVLQFNERPINVVIGNQSAFRVEFIKNNVTIKPISSGVKTNLFIFTENDRFNLTVVSGSSQGVDYVVRVKRTFEDPNKAAQLNRFSHSNGVKLTLLRKIQGRDGTFLDFEISNQTNVKLKLLPDTLRIVRGKTPEAIKSAYFDTSTLAQGGLIRGTAYMPRDPTSSTFEVWFAFDGKRPLKFAFAGKTSNRKESLYAF
ncbi:MAG: TrbG/VirB9 family P-type conjugative transfer protein [Bdellovibrionia bacterium]